jgi:hypothetical protein
MDRNRLNCLTDELERQMMLQAIEEQFRPHPMRALLGGLRKIGHGIKTLTRKKEGKNAH